MSTTFAPTTARPTTGRLAPRRLMLVTLAGLAVAATLSFASPAHAADFTISGPAGRTTTTSQCYDRTLLVQPQSAVQAGYKNGQYISYRIQIWDRSTNSQAFLSAYQPTTLVPYSTVRLGSVVTTPQMPLANLKVTGLPAHHAMVVNVEVIRWSGSAWYSDGWAVSNLYQGMGSTPLNFCWT